jgi:hypothetical protein
MPQLTPVARDNSAACGGFPAVGHTKSRAGLAGAGWPRSKILLLTQAERRIGNCDRLAACIADLRGDSHRGRGAIVTAARPTASMASSASPPAPALHTDPGIITAACTPDRATGKLPVLRRNAQARYAAQCWKGAPCRAGARIEASTMGTDIRTVSPSLTQVSRAHL